MENVSALLSGVIYYSLWLLMLAIWAYVILSYVLPEPYVGFMRVLSLIVKPVLLPFDHLTNKSRAGGGLFYLSPALACLVIIFTMAILP